MKVPKRVLVIPFYGGGHVFPHLAISQALVEAGVDVVFVSEPDYARYARMTGAKATAGPPLVGDGLRIPERSAAYRKRWWASLPRTMTMPLHDLIVKHRADVVVADAMHVAAALAAERAAVPLVSVATAPGFMRAWFGPTTTHSQIDMAPIRKKLGLPPSDKRYADHGLSSSLVLLPWTSEFDIAPPPAQGKHVGILSWDPPAKNEPRWIERWTSAEPTILVSMTSMPFQWKSFTDRYFGAALGALEDLSFRAIVTSAGARLPSAFEHSKRIRVERVIPHGHLVPHVRAIVASAGWGIVSRALTAGVPLVTVPIPIGRDQELNASICERLGIGVGIPFETVDVTSLAAALRNVAGKRSPAALAARAYRKSIRASKPGATAAEAILAMV